MAFKIIHSADIHLGSKLDSKLPREKSDERRAEVRATFSRMVEYAKENGVSVIMLAGDVFDSDRPLKKDKTFFYDVVKANPNIDFLYLRGNHDGKQSYTETLENLKIFEGDWSCYEYGNIAISGIEITPENCISMYSTLKLDRSKKNIVMLHGQAGDAAGNCRINLLKLNNKNIDYLALGHIHSYKMSKLDERGFYAYCGCLEGRGFDETGEKGFVLLEVDDKIKSTFIPFARRTIDEVNVDISGAANEYEAYIRAKSQIKSSSQNLVRVILEGEIDFDNERLSDEVQKHLMTEYYFVSVKDRTRRIFDLKKLEGDISLKGEFIRCVLNDDKLDESSKREIISIGLKALDGREVE